MTASLVGMLDKPGINTQRARTPFAEPRPGSFSGIPQPRKLGRNLEPNGLQNSECYASHRSLTHLWPVFLFALNLVYLAFS